MKAFKHSAALLVCACTASVCNAATVQITFDNPIFSGSGANFARVIFPSESLPNASTVLSVNAGRFQGTASLIEGVPASIFVDGVNDVFMYCYDLYDSIGPGSVANYTINGNGALTRTLNFLGAVNSVMNTGKSVVDDYAWLHPVSGDQGTAIQLGIWESKYETSADWSLALGAFKADYLNQGTTGWWTNFTAAVSTSTPLAARSVMTLESDLVQDMITGDPPPANHVPEPSSLALLGLALAGVGWARRRRG